MLRRFLCALSVVILTAASALAGIRGPGEYSGIVFYDKWDTCYLYDGVYLMYISDKVKERLRKYEGQAIRIDATEVYQPMNPGDGLIKEFKLIGMAKDKRHSQIANLVITITPHFEVDGSPQFIIEVKNRGIREITVSSGAFSPTLFGEKDEGDCFSPSDGKSEARITRMSFPEAKGDSARSEGTLTTPDGQTKTFKKWWGVIIDDGKVSFDDSFLLRPGQSKEFKALISASPGNYEFLCGGWEGDEERISNSVFFNVDEKGKASLISKSQQGSVLQETIQLKSQSEFQNIAHTQPSHKFFSWAALSRAAVVFVIALLTFRRFYCG